MEIVITHRVLGKTTEVARYAIGRYDGLRQIAAIRADLRRDGYSPGSGCGEHMAFVNWISREGWRHFVELLPAGEKGDL